MKCILCGQETTGSIGRAGMRWTRICQSCKDKEDSYAKQMLELQSKQLELIENLFRVKKFMTRNGICEEVLTASNN